MVYFLSPALVRLRSEVNALWPGRSKASDGWIGDTSHAARKSDHNPDYSAGGIVRAIDVTNDGINVDAFISSVIRDARCRYVISRGRIWTRESGWQPYTGPNGHHHHVHVSVRTGGGYDLQIHSWGLTTTVGNNLGGGGSVTNPNIPGAPAPINPEDDMSQADVDAINLKLDQLLGGIGALGAIGTPASDTVLGIVRNLNEQVTGAKGFPGSIAAKVNGLVADLPKVAPAAAEKVWAATVDRGDAGKVNALQELANANNGIALLRGENTGLRAALQALTNGTGLTADQIAEAARAGAAGALKDGVKVTIDIPKEN